MKLPSAANEDGAAAVEFALVLPVLLLIFFAIIEYGWYFTNKLVLTNAVAAGARSAVQAREWEGEQPEAFAFKTVKEGFWLASLSGNNIITRVIPPDDYAPRRIEIQVRNHTFRQLTGFLPAALIPGTLSARSVMVFP